MVIVSDVGSVPAMLIWVRCGGVGVEAVVGYVKALQTLNDNVAHTILPDFVCWLSRIRLMAVWLWGQGRRGIC